jgi:hypothetical protein
VTAQELQPKQAIEFLMYRPPTIFDFERSLDTLIHSGQQRARAAAGEVKSDHVGRGISDSTSVITRAIGLFDAIHKYIIEQAMRMIHEFATRSVELSPPLLATFRRKKPIFAPESS